MPHWLQHLLALTLVAICLIFAARQAFDSLRGKRSKLGSCCAKGCTPPPTEHTKTEKIVFFPADMLAKRK